MHLLVFCRLGLALLWPKALTSSYALYGESRLHTHGEMKKLLGRSFTFVKAGLHLWSSVFEIRFLQRFMIFATYGGNFDTIC